MIWFTFSFNFSTCHVNNACKVDKFLTKKLRNKFYEAKISFMRLNQLSKS